MFGMTSASIVIQQPRSLSNIWHLCDTSNAHLFSIYDVSISPENPRSGGDLTVTVNGTLQSSTHRLFPWLNWLAIVTGGYLHFDLAIARLIKVKKQVDLCEKLSSVAHLDCPLQPGVHDVVVTCKSRHVSRSPPPRLHSSHPQSFSHGRHKNIRSKRWYAQLHSYRLCVWLIGDLFIRKEIQVQRDPSHY